MKISLQNYWVLKEKQLLSHVARDGMQNYPSICASSMYTYWMYNLYDRTLQSLTGTTMPHKSFAFRLSYRSSIIVWNSSSSNHLLPPSNRIWPFLSDTLASLDGIFSFTRTHPLVTRIHVLFATPGNEEIDKQAN